MAKKLRRKNSATENINNYGVGDPLLDILRDYYKRNGTWSTIVANDKELQRKTKQKEINSIRRYK